MDRRMPVTDPVLAHALVTAKRTGKLDELPEEDSRYLLRAYHDAFGARLNSADPNRSGKDALPIVVEFGAISQLLGSDNASRTILERWRTVFAKRPSALNLSNWDQALDCPIEGIGSPSRMVVTRYGTDPRIPDRLCAAGTTPDKLLNRHMASGLFTTALACDPETSLISTVAARLDIGERRMRFDRVLLHASVNAAGVGDASLTGPVLGVSAEEAMSLASEMFSQSAQASGLVRIRDSELSLCERLDSDIASAITETSGEERRFTSRQNPAQSIGRVHITPLLHRTPEGSAEVVTIPVPLELFNPKRLLAIARATRQSYMAELIANGRRREAFCKEMYNTHDKIVKEWESLDETERIRRFKDAPDVTIIESVDFELGLVVPMKQPQKKSRMDFENQIRPALRDSARSYAIQFNELCEKLEKLNRDDGIADKLCLKLVVDSLIRNADIPVENEEFSMHYQSLRKTTSDRLWSRLQTWALGRGYPPELLASHSTVFDSKIDDNEGTVFVIPFVVINLDDYEIIIDRKSGLMYAFTSQHTPSLNDAIKDASDGDGDVTPKELRERAREYLRFRASALTNLSGALNDLKRMIGGNERVETVLLLEQGKGLLMKGAAAEAFECLSKAGQRSPAPVLFWAAVAAQYGRYSKFGDPHSASQNPHKARLNAAIADVLGDLGPVERRLRRTEALVKAALRLDNPERERLLLQSVVGQVIGPGSGLAPRARGLVERLRSKHPSFVSKITRENANLFEVERAELALSEKEQIQLRVAIQALTAVDFLRLGVQMQQTAKRLPLWGSPAPDLRRDMEQIIKAARLQPLHDPPGIEQFEDLAEMLRRA